MSSWKTEDLLKLKMFLNRHGIYDVEQYTIDHIEMFVDIIQKEKEEESNKKQGKEVYKFSKKIKDKADKMNKMISDLQENISDIID
ncbi:MAG: hypothetical protein QXS19_09490 [Candidatus Methanomethylicia archaeon]